MDTFIRITVAMVVAYLLGAIPFALIVSKLFFQIDLRQQGSGNLGATNVVRVLGWRAGLSVAALDIAKGAVAVVIAGVIIHDTLGADAADWVLIATAVCAVLGHSYSPYIRFRGGKGVATGAGAILPITPVACVILVLLFVAIVYTTRMVSLASITGASMYPILCLTMYGDRLAIVVVSFAAAGIVLWRHRLNMVRIVRGEESRIGRGGSALRGVTSAEDDLPDASSKES